MRQAGQAGQARERLLETLIQQLDIPLPERIVEAEVERAPSVLQRPAGAGRPDDAGLPRRPATRPQAKLDEEFDADARRSVKAGFILDKLASQEDLKVTGEQLSAYVTEQAYRMGVAPDRLAQQLTDNGQLPAVAADVLRGNALTLLAERARVIDEAGRPVYISADRRAAAEADGDDG